uniref:Uncharacterized protein n=1 Tax=Timema cristinae TaxID=61476 RepID=A0A7R9H5S5_TIMCR|nr:unnamed protein product [Timema cristinae]
MAHQKARYIRIPFGDGDPKRLGHRYQNVQPSFRARECLNEEMFASRKRRFPVDQSIFQTILVAGGDVRRLLT